MDFHFFSNIRVAGVVKICHFIGLLTVLVTLYGLTITLFGVAQIIPPSPTKKQKISPDRPFLGPVFDLFIAKRLILGH